jgi:hypothetical protein
MILIYPLTIVRTARRPPRALLSVTSYSVGLRPSRSGFESLQEYEQYAKNKLAEANKPYLGRPGWDPVFELQRRVEWAGFNSGRPLMVTDVYVAWTTITPAWLAQRGTNLKES